MTAKKKPRTRQSLKSLKSDLRMQSDSILNLMCQVEELSKANERTFVVVENLAKALARRVK